MGVARGFGKARSVNSNSAALPTWISSEFLTASYYADPGTAASRVVRSLALPGVPDPCQLTLLPFGVGANNDTFTVRVVGVRPLAPPGSDQQIQLIRYPLAVINVTLGNTTGLAGGVIGATERFADTIAITFEGTQTADVTRSGTSVLHSPANDTAAMITIPLLGAVGFELEFAQTLNTPTMNCLFSFAGD